MPLVSCSLSRGSLACCGWFALCVACTQPDGRGLFAPLPPTGASGSNAQSGGIGGAAGAPSIAASGAAAGGASPASNEGLGGSLQLAGTGGVAGGSATGGSATGEMFEGDASVPDIGVVDAGVAEVEAGPPPITCDPSPEVCDGIDNDCNGVIDQAQTCPDECAGFALEEHGYMFCADAVVRGTALARCAAEDMKLAWLETPQENAAVVSAIAGLDLANGGEELVVQIGASDAQDEDDWSWIGNGAALDGFQFWEGNASEDDDAGAVGGAYENWADGEPNDTDGEDCGAISVTGSDNRGSGEWDDRACTVETPFVCEVP